MKAFWRFSILIKRCANSKPNPRRDKYKTWQNMSIYIFIVYSKIPNKMSKISIIDGSRKTMQINKNR